MFKPINCCMRIYVFQIVYYNVCLQQELLHVKPMPHYIFDILKPST